MASELTLKRETIEVPSDKETTNTDRYYMANGKGPFSGTIYTPKGWATSTALASAGTL